MARRHDLCADGGGCYLALVLTVRTQDGLGYERDDAQSWTIEACKWRWVWRDPPTGLIIIRTGDRICSQGLPKGAEARGIRSR